ncbi:site-specific DNA-methyltransferase [Helicobacter vulpis]|uniref:site-specific DNA-methyltransferase n=1 Tax=Helicobacter vulpis TaxID=2316076 RepID=UPI00196959D9|nr:site-specific DNA-methyltransferase [Helicobacter vulpis]
MSQDFTHKKLELYKQKIREIPNTSFNADQKKLALEILEKADPHNLEAIFSLLAKRIEVGFVFDIAPEVQQDAICLLKHNKELSFTPALCQQQHAMIFGENYDALKNLLVLYRGKVDCIYIDPPYNTESTKQDGNDYKSEQNSSGKFGYRDKFMRTGWLNMLNERLKLAKDLLSDRGVIFISIDDSEQAYLKVLCDEIFGEGNFVANLVWQKKKGGSQDSQDFAKEHEYILCYSKGTWEIYEQTQRHEEKDFNKTIDGKRAKILKLEKWGNHSLRTDRPTLYYPIKDPNGQDFYPIAPSGAEGCWRKKPENLDPEHIFWQEDSKGRLTPYEVLYFEEVQGKDKIIKTRTIFTDCGTTTDATKEIQAIFGTKAFATPKPTSLILKLLKIATSPNSLVLDFYAGSGTTGQALMELNREDGGNRRCILVTNTENNIARGVMYERIYRLCYGKGTKGESFAWADKNEPFSDQGWEVFEGQTHHLKIDDYETGERLKEVAIKAFKTLEPSCDLGDELNIYYTLSCLNPQKQEPKPPKGP